MSNFAAALTGSEDSTGTIATFNDNSNYLSNTEGYTTANFSRSIVLADAYGNILTTLPLTGTTLSVTYPLTQDQWIYAQLFLVGINPVPNYQSALNGFPFDRITKNLYRSLLKSGCCQGKFEENQLLNADNYFTGASIEALAGDAAGFNNDIQAANAYLSPNP